ncbi:precorrin-3B synthase [Nonomuraea sp. NPDC000554]|uniref:precorrin-3B synthase n=1 Tax=Nonomuraea sp. NPDC000554 TaxID=3154259 RepID=UPI0033259797
MSIVGRTRRDACPGALQVHQAADGPLARVRIPGGLLSASQLRALAACAEELGSGVIELTSRANLQLRGLRDLGLFAERIAAAGLLPSPTHERVRNIVASPLVDRELIIDLDRALCARPELAELPGRFLFALGETGLAADVALMEGRLLLAGRETGLPGTVAGMLDTAEVFLRLRSTEWRISELGPARIAEALGTKLGTTWPGTPPSTRPGPSQALIPLGRLSPRQLLALAEAAEEVRFTPWRTVVLPRVPDGFIADPDSPWVGVTACVGSPGCAKSLADVRADAARWVHERHTDRPVHWAGCERLCGLPPGPVVQMVATPGGYQERQT